MKKLLVLALTIVNAAVLLASAHAADKMIGSMVYFRSGETTLRGYLYRPEGSGPFPAVVYVRSSNRPITESAPPVPELAQFYTSKGFVLFVPNHRTAEELKADAKGAVLKNKKQKRKLDLPEYSAMTKDIAAAVTWLKSQSFVNENRVAVAGQGAGATASLLLSQQDVDVSGYILFSPAAQNWTEKPHIRQALADAVRESRAPIFFIQPQNDHTLEPSQILGKVVNAKPAPSMAKVYPPFGTTHERADKFAFLGSSVWGNDIMGFLNKVFNL